MITLIVVAIVVAIAAPSFGQMIRENRAATQANNVLASLQLAKTEAIKRGVRVVMRSESGIDNIWEQGWIVFTDWDADSTFGGNRDEKDCSVVNQDCILKIQEALPGNITFRSRARHAKWLAFLPSGQMQSSGGATDVNNGTMIICTNLDPVLSIPRHIILNNVGRAYINGEEVEDKPCE